MTATRVWVSFLNLCDRTYLGSGRTHELPMDLVLRVLGVRLRFVFCWLDLTPPRTLACTCRLVARPGKDARHPKSAFHLCRGFVSCMIVRA